MQWKEFSLKELCRTLSHSTFVYRRMSVAANYESEYFSREGDILFEAGKLAGARAIYLREARKLVGLFYTLPGTSGEGDGGVQRDVYIKLNPIEQTNLMGCCLGMAKCFWQENDL